MAREERIFFQKIAEPRDGYFVEYNPPRPPSLPFACLSVTFSRTLPSATEIAEILEREVRLWLSKFPVMLFASAFDDTGSLHNLTAVRPYSHLMGYVDLASQRTVLTWGAVGNDELPKQDLSPAALKALYVSVPYKTQRDVDDETRHRARQLKIGWLIVFVWAAVVPGLVAILGWASPLVGAVTTIYALWQAIRKALQLLGKWPRAQREIAKEEEDRSMRHHHLHCKENPEGFQRLKLENFERWQREETKKEDAALRKPGA